MNLQEMKVKELLEIAKELKITGRYDMKKGELIEAIQAAQTVEETEVKVTEQNESDSNGETQVENTEQIEEEVKPKPVKEIKSNKRPLILYNESDEVVQRFESQKECTVWCLENQISNQGWISVAIREGRQIYRTKEGKATRSQKNKGYIGYDYKIQYAI